MVGNVWEWTRSLFGDYPYNPNDGRENASAPGLHKRVVRGGYFAGNQRSARTAFRTQNLPDLTFIYLGFRVVIVPISRGHSNADVSLQNSLG
jgi:formylglycine-generating enzyme required for sulfatase activity